MVLGKLPVTGRPTNLDYCGLVQESLVKRVYDTSSNDTLSAEPFRRKHILSKYHFVECPLRRIMFRRILSTKYFMLTRPP